MRWIVAVLYLASGLLLLSALGMASFRVLRERRGLITKLDEIDRIIGDESLSNAERTEQAKKVLEPRFNYGRLTYTYEWIRRLILEDAVTDLGVVAVLTTLGVVSGTAASIWSLWPPS